MISQSDIHAAFLRAAFDDLVDPGRPVAWFGAGALALRLASALDSEALARVEAIFDDNPAHDSIAGIPVRKPDAGAPPAQIVLATDTHAPTLRCRAGAIWRRGPSVIDLFAPPIGAWTDSGDAPGGFARTHPERWRQALGLAQIDLETQGEPIHPRRRWLLAHGCLNNAPRRFDFTIDERDRFSEEQAAIPTGMIVTVQGEKPIRDDPFWSGLMDERHVAVSADGMRVAITWARRDEFPVCPGRSGNALWIPHEPTNIISDLYMSDGASAKAYTVRFDSGAEREITATRERTYADIRATAELSRYERFITAIPPGARILDCAAGTGPGADLLASLGFDVVGVEIDPGAVAFAMSRYPHVLFERASATRLPFPDNHFDAVISVETIEHLPDPGAAIDEFARVCKPDGLLCLTTPDEGACDSPFHAVELTSADLRSALDHAFGSGGWVEAPLESGGSAPEPWHAMIVRSAQCAQL